MHNTRKHGLTVHVSDPAEFSQTAGQFAHANTNTCTSQEIETKKNNLETVELAAGKAYDEAESTTTMTRIERID